jgi:ApaG protein
MTSIQSTRLHGSEAITEGIRVNVESYAVEEDSRPAEGVFVFGYRITITNESPHAVHLLSRRWLVIDGVGTSRVIEGEGVVGEQPWIEPGRAFRYASFCPLPTEWGTMEGAYHVARADGHRFDAEIARFILAWKR